MSRARGSALVTGLILLSLITLLGLAAAAAARIELQLANHEQFRENAASAASAGLEFALAHMTAMTTDTDFSLSDSLPGAAAARARYEVSARFLGYEPGIPQAPGAQLAAAHFEILSTGHSAFGAFDRQRALVIRVVPASAPVTALDCEPAAPGIRCLTANELLRLSWQRMPRP